MTGTACWPDSFVYDQCCDNVFGPHGLDLCFLQAGLSFSLCCSPQLRPKVTTRDDECASTFSAVSEVLAIMMQETAFASKRTFDDLHPSFDASLHQEITEYLRHSTNMTFSTFLWKAARYYTDGVADMEMMTMAQEILANFGDAMHVCASAALIAGLLKVETVLHRDCFLGGRMISHLETLLTHMEQHNKLQSLAHLNAKATLRKLMLDSHCMRNASSIVDLVIPICSEKDVQDLKNSFSIAFSSLQELQDFEAGFRLPLAIFRLQLYDTCGLLAKHVSNGCLQDSTIIFDAIPTRAWAFFERHQTKPPLVRVESVQEDIPVGDVAAYLIYFASVARASPPASFSLMLHSDFMEHVRPVMIDQVLGGLISGGWNRDKLDFLYLGWRHETGMQVLNKRVASHVHTRCSIRLHDNSLGLCDGSSLYPLDIQEHPSESNQVLLGNLWSWAFGQPFNAGSNNFGGYDFSQFLVSRRAILQRPASFWRYLSSTVVARSSYELLPGTRHVSQRVDLSLGTRFNKGVSNWFEHFWHLLLDQRFFPDAAPFDKDLRMFTRLSDPLVPLGFRTSPDNVMLSHYWLPAERRCQLLHDHMSCRLMRLVMSGERSWLHLSMS